MRGVLLAALVGLMVWALPGCGRPPIHVSIEKLAAAPSVFRNQEVEVGGYVKRNEMRGDSYVTWNLVLERNGHQIRCFESGYNPQVVAEGYHLAREAMEAGDQIRVRGKFRVNHGEIEKGTVLELDTVEYKGTVIRTDYDDYRYLYRPWPWWYFGGHLSYWH